MARWPSGLRRQNQAYVSHLVRKGVGSNPTLVTFILFLFEPVQRLIIEQQDSRSA